MREKAPPESKRHKRRREESDSHEPVSLPVWPEPVKGRSLVRSLQEFLDELRETDAHGNRALFLDDVFVGHLLAFFNPSIRSLRKLEDFSQTRQAQAVLNTNRLSKSTLSDYHPFADAARIEPIIAQLRDAVNKRHGKQLPKDLEQLGKEIIAA